jgi:hypothetical protein
MGIKISELTPDANITGVEIIPVSDGGAAKSVTTGGVKDFTIDSIEGLTAAAGVTGADGVYILKGGELKPVNIDHVAQYAIDKVWGKAAENTVDAADKLPLKDGGTEKTVTAANLAVYILGAIKASVLDVSTLDTATLGAGDYLLVTQGTTAKKTTLSAINAAIYAALKSYVAALSAATSTNDADLLYIVQGGVEKKISITTLKAAFGSTVAPATTTENKVPQWSSAQKTLKDGLTVQTSIRAAGTAADTALATEKAVRDAVEAPTRSAGAEGGAVVMRLGKTDSEGLETIVVDKTVTLGAVAGVAIFTVPVGAILWSVQANVSTAAVAGGTSVKIGIGTDDDPGLYGITSALTKNLKIDTTIGARLATETAIKAFPCAAAGTIGDTAFTSGAIRVRIIYDRLKSLDDAN